jgi:hypothetical protein
VLHDVTSLSPKQVLTLGFASDTTSSTNEQRKEEAEEQNVHYGNDVGLWEDDMSKERRDWWIERGSKDCQHKDSDFKESAGSSKSETFVRHCSKAYFTRVHSLTGEKIERTWLCYSPTTGCLYCFACKLVSRPLILM